MYAKARMLCIHALTLCLLLNLCVLDLQTDPQLTVHKTGDVIEFYNAVFVPEAKALLMRVSRGDQPLHSPPGELMA